MGDAFGKVVAIMLGIVLTFVMPMQYARSRMTTLEEMYVLEKSVELVDAVRNTGYLTQDMYETFNRELSNLSQRYVADIRQTAPTIVDGRVENYYYDKADIEGIIYDNGVEYAFRRGDYVRLQVRRLEKGDSEAAGTLVCSYGGYVHNEIY